MRTSLASIFFRHQHDFDHLCSFSRQQVSSSFACSQSNNEAKNYPLLWPWFMAVRPDPTSFRLNSYSNSCLITILREKVSPLEQQPSVNNFHAKFHINITFTHLDFQHHKETLNRLLFFMTTSIVKGGDKHTGAKQYFFRKLSKFTSLRSRNFARIPGSTR